MATGLKVSVQRLLAPGTLKQNRMMVGVCGGKSFFTMSHCGIGGREEDTNGKEKEEEAASRGKMFSIIYFCRLDCEIQNFTLLFNQLENKCFTS